MNPTVSKPTAMASVAGLHRKDSAMLKFKIMMLGDAGVGKTSIARRFTDENFLPTYIHTIGIDFLEKTIRFRNSTDDSTADLKEVPQIDAKLQIWDTAGQDRWVAPIKDLKEHILIEPILQPKFNVKSLLYSTMTRLLFLCFSDLGQSYDPTTEERPELFWHTT